MDPRHHRASGGLLCSSQGYYDDCSGVGHEGPCSTENSYSTEVRIRPISTVQDRSQDSSGLFLVDCPQATERFRSRHHGGPNARTTLRIVAGQAQYDPTEPKASYLTGRRSADHRHHRLGDDGKKFSMKVQQHLKTQRKIAWFVRQKSWISRSTTRVYLRNWRYLRRRRT